MGCGCDGPVIGTVPTHPYLIGTINGVTVHVRAEVNGFTFRRHQEGWVTGTGVQARIDAGWLTVIG